MCVSLLQSLLLLAIAFGPAHVIPLHISKWLNPSVSNWYASKANVGWLATWVFAAGLQFLISHRNNDNLFRSSLIAIAYGACASLLLNFQPNNDHAKTLAGLSAYALLCFAQHCNHRNFKTLHYHQLFNQVWNNIAALFLTGVFVLLTYLVLLIASSLLRSVDSELLSTLLRSLFFNLIALPIIFATGLYAVLRSGSVCKQLRQIALNFFQLLTPVLAVLGIVLLITTSLHWLAIGNSNHNQSVTLSLLAFFGIISTNACYRTGDKPTKPFYRYLLLVINSTMSLVLLQSVIAIVMQLSNHSPTQQLHMDLICKLAIVIVMLAYHILYLFCKPKNIHHYNFSLAWFAILISISLCFAPDQQRPSHTKHLTHSTSTQ